MPLSPRDRLIIALDLPSVTAAQSMVERLGDAVSFYKIGLELAIAGGLPLVGELAEAGYKIFLDLKIHDIGNTVERATARAAEMGASFLTVHAYHQTMQAAAKGRANSELKILGVTVLTSWDKEELTRSGVTAELSETVVNRARQACDCGIDGIVCSAGEASLVRSIIGQKKTIVTPGIRPLGSAMGDQNRVMTPAEAIKEGADYLVVGRPVTSAPDPRAAASAIIAEIENALS